MVTDLSPRVAKYLLSSETLVSVFLEQFLEEKTSSSRDVIWEL